MWVIKQIYVIQEYLTVFFVYTDSFVLEIALMFTFYHLQYFKALKHKKP